MYRIGILNKIINPDVESGIIKGQAEVTCFDVLDENNLPDAAKIIDVAIIFHRLKLTKIGIDKLEQCRLIICASVGFDNVDIDYAKKKNIPVINVPDYGVDDVADHSIALFLAYVRKVVAFSSALKQNISENWDPLCAGEYHRITNRNFGIVGLGRIGTAVALRAKAFGLNVSYYDPYKPSGYEKVFHIRKCNSLEELFSTNDFVSIHVPLTEETKGMVTTEMLAAIDNNPVIINTARGAVIRNDTIFEALENKYIEAYLTDVLEVEPPLHGGELFCRYLSSGRLLITPHAAAYAAESLHEMRFRAAESAVVFLERKKLSNCVNFEGIKTWT